MQNIVIALAGTAWLEVQINMKYYIDIATILPVE